MEYLMRSVDILYVLQACGGKHLVNGTTTYAKFIDGLYELYKTGELVVPVDPATGAPFVNRYTGRAMFEPFIAQVINTAKRGPGVHWISAEAQLTQTHPVIKVSEMYGGDATISDFIEGEFKQRLQPIHLSTPAVIHYRKRDVQHKSDTVNCGKWSAFDTVCSEIAHNSGIDMSDCDWPRARVQAADRRQKHDVGPRTALPRLPRRAGADDHGDRALR